MDGQKLDELRKFVRWTSRHYLGQQHAEWALAQIEELIAEKTELQIDLHDCAAMMAGTPYIDMVIKCGVPLPTALKKMVSELREQIALAEKALESAEWNSLDLPEFVRSEINTALAKLKPN